MTVQQPTGDQAGTDVMPAADGAVLMDPDERDPQIYKEMTDAQRQLFEEAVERASQDRMSPQYPVITGTVEVSAFVKAQAEAYAAQTRFLLHRGSPQDNPGDYIYELSEYSRSQGKLIEAQAAVLKALGVI